MPQNGARVVARAWVDPAFRARLLANGRAAVDGLGLSMPKHHRHLVVLENTPKYRTSSVARCARAPLSRSSDCRRTGTRTSSIARASSRIAHRAEGDGTRPVAGSRNPRLGHDRGHALHGAARAAAGNRRLDRRTPRRNRDARFADRRRAPLAGHTSSSPDGRNARHGRPARLRPVRYTHNASAFHAAGKCAPIRFTLSRCGSASSTWTNTVTRSSGWSRAITSRRATTNARSRASRRSRRERHRDPRGAGAAAPGRFPLAAPSAPGRTNAPGRQRFAPGDRVRVKADYVPGHMRMPGYIRGKSGVVVSESPAYPFPDAHAHAVESEDEPTYDVRFRTRGAVAEFGRRRARPRCRVPELSRASRVVQSLGGHAPTPRSRAGIQ